MELKKTAHHSCTLPRTADNVLLINALTDKDSSIPATVSHVSCIPELREMVDNVLQTSAHRDKGF